MQVLERGDFDGVTGHGANAASGGTGGRKCGDARNVVADCGAADGELAGVQGFGMLYSGRSAVCTGGDVDGTGQWRIGRKTGVFRLGLVVVVDGEVVGIKV